MVEHQGVTDTHQVVTCEIIPADEEITALLGLENDQQVLVRRRVMWTNEAPSMIGDSYYPLAFVGNSRLPDPADIPEGDDQELEDLGHIEVYVQTFPGDRYVLDYEITNDWTISTTMRLNGVLIVGMPLRDVDGT